MKLKAIRSWYSKSGKKRFIRLYAVWRCMRTRCRNKNRRDYKYYGGRGITICDEWQDFAVFRQWAIGSGYGTNLTLDRRDNNGNYEPRNCHWVTRRDQMRNTRHKKYVICEFEDAISICISGKPYNQLVDEYGLSAATISRVKSGLWFRGTKQ